MKIDIASPQKTDVKRYGFVVLGMHRSGTSALTRVLNLAGCTLPTSLIGSTEGNERGHWESAKFNEVNNLILSSAGSTWKDWSALSEDWYQSPISGEMSARVVDVINSELPDARLAVIKDPRTCKIAPLWLDAMNSVGLTPLPILMVRHPAEVANSLYVRNRINREIGQLIWLRYLLDAERATRGKPRCIVSYSELLTDWKSCLAKVSTSFGIKFPMPVSKLSTKVSDYLSRDLRHHNINESSPNSTAPLLEWANSAWSIFSTWLQVGERPDDYPLLDELQEKLTSSQDAFERLTALAQTEHGNRLRLKELESKLGKVEAEREGALADLQAVQKNLSTAQAEHEARGNEQAQQAHDLEQRLSSAITETKRLDLLLQGLEKEKSGALSELQAAKGELDALRAAHQVRWSEQVQRTAELEQRLGLTALEKEHLTLLTSRLEADKSGVLSDLQAAQAELDALKTAQDMRWREYAERTANLEERLLSAAESNEQLTLHSRNVEAERLAAISGLLAAQAEIEALRELQDARFREQARSIADLERRLVSAGDEKDLISAKLNAVQSSEATARQLLEVSESERRRQSTDLQAALAQIEALRKKPKPEALTSTSTEPDAQTKIEAATRSQERSPPLAIASSTNAADVNPELQNAPNGLLTAANLFQYESEAKSLKAKVTKLLGKVDDAEGRTRRIAKLAAERDVEISRLKQEIKTVKRAMSASGAVQGDSLSLELMKALFSSVRFPIVHKHRLKNLVSFARRLNLIDSKWYTERYPDVASSRLSPEEHFIRFGAREGRVPSPRFDRR